MVVATRREARRTHCASSTLLPDCPNGLVDCWDLKTAPFLRCPKHDRFIRCAANGRKAVLGARLSHRASTNLVFGPSHGMSHVDILVIRGHIYPKVRPSYGFSWPSRFVFLVAGLPSGGRRRFATGSGWSLPTCR